MKSIQFDMVLKLFIVLLFSTTYANQIIDMYSNNLDSGFGQSELNQIGVQGSMTRGGTDERVTLQIYYECLCPDCRQLDSHQLVPLVHRFAQFGHNLEIFTYPYGNAVTHQDPSGRFIFRCQHGPKECYGNMLHACAIEALQDNNLAVLFNACMMDYSQKGLGSDDAAADVCGRSMQIDTTPIKQCAKSERGIRLLKYYGDESKKVNFNYVPYILINGKVSNGENLMKDICEAFKNPPMACFSRG